MELFWSLLDIAKIAKNGTGHLEQGNDTGRNAEWIHSGLEPDAETMNRENDSSVREPGSSQSSSKKIDLRSPEEGQHRQGPLALDYVA